MGGDVVIVCISCVHTNPNTKLHRSGFIGSHPGRRFQKSAFLGSGSAGSVWMVGPNAQDSHLVHTTCVRRLTHWLCMGRSRNALWLRPFCLLVKKLKNVQLSGSDGSVVQSDCVMQIYARTLSNEIAFVIQSGKSTWICQKAPIRRRTHVVWTSPEDSCGRLQRKRWCHCPPHQFGDVRDALNFYFILFLFWGFYSSMRFRNESVFTEIIMNRIKQNRIVFACFGSVWTGPNACNQCLTASMLEVKTVPNKSANWYGTLQIICNA